MGVGRVGGGGGGVGGRLKRWGGGEAGGIKVSTPQCCPGFLGTSVQCSDMPLFLLFSILGFPNF